jgi:transposase
VSQANQKREYLGPEDKIKKPDIKAILSRLTTKNYGNIVDASTIHNFLDRLQVYNLKDLTLVMDRGFFSTSNISGLPDSPARTGFLQPLSFSLKKAKELVRENVGALNNTNTAFKYNEEIFHHVTAPIDLHGKTLTAHVFFNEKAELDQKLRFLSRLLDIESGIRERKFDSSAEAQSFIQSEIAERSRMFFRWDKTSL